MDHADIVKLPLTCSSLYAYIIDESLLVYSRKTQNVYGFEKGSAAFFLQLDALVQSHSYDDIVKQFPTVDAVSLTKIYTLASGKEPVNTVSYEKDMAIGTYIKDALHRTYYQADDIAFAVHYPDDAFLKYLHPVYKHLHVEKPDAANIISVDFVRSGELWDVHWNRIPLNMAIPKSKLATYLQDKMMTCSYQVKPYLISLHAASVEKNGKVIIMPAVAESGKTTLTATLLHHGFKLFSDESTTLDNNGCVYPLPFCMNIKEGSWNILAKKYPHLNARTVHSRFDGQNIRFLPPENMSKGHKKASHIIFPKYTPDANTSLEPISANEALSRITEASYQVKNDMDNQKFELILQNLISLPKYMLVYSNLDEAINTIDRLLGS